MAKLLSVLVVFALGIAFAGVLSEDEPDVAPKTAKALDRAERAAGARSDRLAETRDEVDRLERRVSALERRLRASGSRNRRLTRALRSARQRVRELQP